MTDGTEQNWPALYQQDCGAGATMDKRGSLERMAKVTVQKLRGHASARISRPQSLQIRVHHHLDQFCKADLGPPAQALTRLARIGHEHVHLGGPPELPDGDHEPPPRPAGLSERHAQPIPPALSLARAPEPDLLPVL